MKQKSPKQKEASVHYQVAQYLKNQYPNVIFRTDFSAGVKMTMGQAIKHKSLQSGRAYPDLFIAQPKPNKGAVLMIDISAWPENVSVEDFLKTYRNNPLQIVRSEDTPAPIQFPQYHGLYIELKQPDTTLIRPKDAKKILKDETKLRKAGDWFDGHIEEQAETLGKLRTLGYKAEFACGFDEAKKLIDEYLK